MTKYQKGELMEGWNDCPVPMLSSRNSSTSSLGSKSRRKTVRLQALPSGNAAMLPSKSGSSANTPPISKDQEELTLEEFSETLTSYVKSSNADQEKLKDTAGALISSFPTLFSSQQKFMVSIVTGVIGNLNLASLKRQILQYTMTNNDSSDWCMELKKLVDLVGETN